MEVDKKISETTEKVLDALNSSGLTLGIMNLILKDILHTINAQMQVNLHKEDETDGTD